MKHTVAKLFLITVPLAVLGCASSPKVKELSECRYGDNETDIVTQLGIGSELLYFRLGDDDYHYRSYTVGRRGTGPVYGLLFKNGQLSVMAKEGSLLFDRCLKLELLEQWGTCFSDAIRKMEKGHVDVNTDAFSEGIEAEHAATREDAIAGAIGGPVYVILWPLYILGNTSSVLSLKAAAQCEMIPSTLVKLYPAATVQLLLEELGATHPDLVSASNDSVSDDRRIIGRTWECGEGGTDLSPGRIRFHPKIEVQFGYTANRMNWLYMRLNPVWWKWPGSMEDKP